LAGPGLDGPAGVGEHDADLVGADVVVLVQVEYHLGGNGQHVGSFQTGRGHVAPGFPGATSLVGSEAGDGGVDAVDDGLVQLVPGHGTRGAPSPLDVDLAVGGVPVHLVDGAEEAAGLAVGDGLPVQRSRPDVAGLVPVDLQADELGPVVEVDPVVVALGPPVAADGDEGLDGELHLLLLRAGQADAVVEGGGVDVPAPADLGGVDGAHAAPGADGGGGNAGLGGGLGDGEGGHSDRLHSGGDLLT